MYAVLGYYLSAFLFYKIQNNLSLQVNLNTQEDLQPHLFDTIFQMINDEMNDNYIFDSTEYLTEAGLELFEDEWFEFYHENHGKIMHKLLQNLK